MNKASVEKILKNEIKININHKRFLKPNNLKINHC